MRRCPDSTAGCAVSDDTGVCDTSTSGCTGGNDTDALCAGNLLGTFCRACPSGNGSTDARVYYRAATETAVATCASCEGVVGRYVGIWAALSMAALALPYALAWATRKLLPSHVSKTCSRLWHASTPHISLKILLGFFFIAARLEEVYKVTLPGPVRRAFSLLVTVTFLGLGDDVPLLTCMGIQGFLHRLAFWIATPFVLIAIIVLGSLVYLLLACRCSCRTIVYVSLPLITRLLFFLYPILTNVAFLSFTCYEFDGANFSRLVADVEIDCYQREDGSEYNAVVRAGWVAIGLHQFGIILAFLALLLFARRAIISDKPTKLSDAIAFLHREFKVEFFFWELVEMLRRLALVGLFVLLERGSITQLMAGSAYNLLHLLIQLHAAPYKQLHDNFLANICNLALSILFLALIMFKIGTMTSLGKVQKVLSLEQRSDLNINSLALTSMLIASLTAGLVVCSLLLVNDLLQEHERIRLEVQMSKARRLRFAGSDVDVVAPKLQAGEFSLLYASRVSNSGRKWRSASSDSLTHRLACAHSLSHVWGTGQDQMRVIKLRLLEMIPDVKVFLGKRRRNAIWNCVSKLTCLRAHQVDMSARSLACLAHRYRRPLGRSRCPVCRPIAAHIDIPICRVLPEQKLHARTFACRLPQKALGRASRV